LFATLRRRALPYAAPIPPGPDIQRAVGADTPTRAPQPALQAPPPARAYARGEPRIDSTNPASNRGGGTPSAVFSRTEVLLAALVGVALAVLTSWPLVLHLSSRIAPDLGDPVRTAWQIAWVGHAMLHDPLHLFDSNAFYPHPLSLAFSDSLLGYGPTAFIGSGPVAALVRYNLLFLFAWALCFLGAYLLARELRLGRIGAAAAGIAFAYAPYRVTEAGHLHVISSGGIPLALFLLLRGYRRRAWGLVGAGWLVSAWQVSLGFTLGMQYAYLLLVLALLAAWRIWRTRVRSHPEGSPPTTAEIRGSALITLPRSILAVTCVGVALLGLITVYQARPYLKVAADYPTARRTVEEVKRYSSGPAALVAASSQNRIWGAATAPLRGHVGSKNEDVFFPGLAILALVLLGLRAPLYQRRLRFGLIAGALVCSLLALGLGPFAGGYPYRLLYDYAPGWDGVRVPGRVFTLATLAYALLAGAGAQWLVELLRRRRELRLDAQRTDAGPAPPGGRSGLLPALAGGALLLCLLGEGAGRLAHPAVPRPAAAEHSLRGPLLDLPTDEARDRIWQYFSTNGFPDLANGTSTFRIPSEDDLRGGMQGFPDRASVEKLRWYGIRTVVLHLQALPLPPTPSWERPAPQDPRAAAAKPIAGLGLTRRRFGDIVIYHVGPGPRALHGSD
jgi:hypothetical protein